MYVRQRNYLELVILLVDIYNNQLDLRDFYIDLEKLLSNTNKRICL